MIGVITPTSANLKRCVLDVAKRFSESLLNNHSSPFTIRTMENNLVKPKKELTKADVMWAMYDNFDASRTLHHCLYNVIRKRWDGEEWVSNAALCNRKHRVCDENEESTPIETLDICAGFNEKTACKSCLKIYNKLKS